MLWGSCSFYRRNWNHKVEMKRVIQMLIDIKQGGIKINRIDINSLIHIIIKDWRVKYHRQQNKWYPKRVFLPISKLHSILAIANLLAHNDVSQICYTASPISLQSAAVNCSFNDCLATWGYHLFCWRWYIKHFEA